MKILHFTILRVVGVAVALPSSQNVQSTNLFTEIGRIGEKVLYEFTEGTKKNWLETMELCRSNGFEFGMTENNEEFQFLFDQRNGKDFWIGASQKGLLDDNGSPHFFTAESFEFMNGNIVSNDNFGEEGINYHQSTPLTQCLYASGMHTTYVGSCIIDQHHVLCEKSIS